MTVALFPVDAQHTRLLWRQHGTYGWTTPSLIIPQLFSDAADLIAVRQNLLGIKARAERLGPPAPATVYTELALWLAAFCAFLGAEAALILRRDWIRPVVAVLITGLTTVTLVLAKPRVWIDALVGLFSWAIVVDPIGDHAARVVTWTRAIFRPSLAMELIARVLVGPGELVMTEQVLRGIKRRAEQRERSKRTTSVSSGDRPQCRRRADRHAHPAEGLARVASLGGPPPVLLSWRSAPAQSRGQLALELCDP